MKQIVIAVKNCAQCPYCVYFETSAARVCVNPMVIESVSNDKGLRIDKPEMYFHEGFPDWCPLEEKPE